MSQIIDRRGAPLTGQVGQPVTGQPGAARKPGIRTILNPARHSATPLAMGVPKPSRAKEYPPAPPISSVNTRFNDGARPLFVNIARRPSGFTAKTMQIIGLQARAATSLGALTNLEGVYANAKAKEEFQSARRLQNLARARAKVAWNSKMLSALGFA